MAKSDANDVARLEQVPISQRQVVLVCQFEDAPDDGQWIVVDGANHEPFCVEKPENSSKSRRIVGRAFGKQGLDIARVVQLNVAPLQVALLTAPLKGFGRFDWNGIVWREPAQVAPFVLDEPIATLDETDVRALLQRAWNDEQSDVRFAWKWAQLSRDEKMARLSGYPGEWTDLRRVMRLILLSTPEIWNRGDVWRWSLHPQFASRGHLVNALNRRDNAPNVCIVAWQEWLYARFVPDSSDAMLEKHICAREFWRDAGTLESVRIDAPPTMHEQLEARLELREWQQNKAAPDEIARLLSI